MLNIRVNDQPVDLDPDQAFEVVSTNPVTDKDRINRAFSFPFSIPASPNNLRIRAHAHRLDALKVRKHDSGRVQFGGHQLLIGEIKTSKTSDQGEEAYIQNLPLRVWDDLKDFKITEILEEVDISGITTVAAVWWFIVGTPPNTYQIKIGDEIFFYSSLPGDTTYDVVLAMVALINAEYPGMAYGQPTTGLFLYSEMINEYPIDQTILLHITLNSVVTLGQQAMQRMLTHVEDVFNTPSASHCFPIVRWHDLYPSGENTLFSNWINSCIDGTAFINSKDKDKRWANTFVPMVRVPYILEKIRARLGAVSWVGDIFESEAIQSLIVASNYCLDKLYFDRYPDDDDMWYINGFEQSWSLNACVPDMSAADFIREICDLYALTLDYGDGSLQFKKSKIRADKKPISLDKKAAKRYNISKNGQNGWVMRYKDNLLEKHSEVGQLNSVITGDGDVKVEVARTFYMTSDYAFSLGGYIKTPITQQPGSARVFSSGSSRTSLPLTFLLERGQQAAELGNLYILASSDTTDYSGAEIGDFALSIEEDKGLISIWHSGTIEYADGDLLSLTAVMTLGDIQKIMQWDTAKATFFHPLGQVTGIIRSIRVRMSGSTIEPVSIDLLIKRSQ